MASGRLRRFLHLERARREPAEAPAGGERERFAGLEGPAPAAPERPPPVAADRFREPGERPLEFAERGDGAQPFLRCARCETDNTAYARACQGCGADLGLPEQRRFNERLWAARRAEAAREEDALARRRQERERLEAEARRDLGETLARREAHRVRGELARARWGGAGGWGLGWGGDPTPWGLRLLRLVPGTAGRIAVALAAAGLPLLLMAVGGRGSRLRLVGLALLVLLAGLLTPNLRFGGSSLDRD